MWSVSKLQVKSSPESHRKADWGDPSTFDRAPLHRELYESFMQQCGINPYHGDLSAPTIMIHGTIPKARRRQLLPTRYSQILWTRNTFKWPLRVKLRREGNGGQYTWR